MQAMTVYIWRGKAYLPRLAQIASGAFMDIEPVLVSEVTSEAMSRTMELVLNSGHPQLPDPTREEVKQRKDPILQATKARSWKALAATGACYTIGWYEKGVSLEMSRLDSKGRWEYDPNKKRLFPLGIAIPIIADAILSDVQSRVNLRAMIITPPKN